MKYAKMQRQSERRAKQIFEPIIESLEEKNHAWNKAYEWLELDKADEKAAMSAEIGSLKTKLQESAEYYTGKLQEALDMLSTVTDRHEAQLDAQTLKHQQERDSDKGEMENLIRKFKASEQRCQELQARVTELEKKATWQCWESGDSIFFPVLTWPLSPRTAQPPQPYLRASSRSGTYCGARHPGHSEDDGTADSGWWSTAMSHSVLLELPCFQSPFELPFSEREVSRSRRRLSAALRPLSG